MPKEQLTLFPEDSHAKTFQLQESVLDWMESDLDSGLNLQELLTKLSQNGWLSKTYQAYSLQQTERILPPSFNGWQTAGMVWAGECLTLNISDWPNDEKECLLSQVLEQQVLPKYYLSKIASQGIIRRAEKKGKKIPIPLMNALKSAAGME